MILWITKNVYTIQKEDMEVTSARATHSWTVSGLNKTRTYTHYKFSSILLHQISEELLWGELVRYVAAYDNP